MDVKFTPKPVEEAELEIIRLYRKFFERWKSKHIKE